MQVKHIAGPILKTAASPVRNLPHERRPSYTGGSVPKRRSRHSWATRIPIPRHRQCPVRPRHRDHLAEPALTTSGTRPPPGRVTLREWLGRAARADACRRVHPGELDWPATWSDRTGRDRTPSVPGHVARWTSGSASGSLTWFIAADRWYAGTDARVRAAARRECQCRPVSPHPSSRRRPWRETVSTPWTSSRSMA